MYGWLCELLKVNVCDTWLLVETANVFKRRMLSQKQFLFHYNLYYIFYSTYSVFCSNQLNSPVLQLSLIVYAETDGTISPRYGMNWWNYSWFFVGTNDNLTFIITFIISSSSRIMSYYNINFFQFCITILQFFCLKFILPNYIG